MMHGHTNIKLKMFFLASGCAWHLTVICGFSAWRHFGTWLQLNFLFVSTMLNHPHFICLVTISVVPCRFVMHRKSFGAVCFETALGSTLCWPGVLPVACLFASSVQLTRCCWLYSDRLIVWLHVFYATFFQPRWRLRVRLTLDQGYEILGLLE